MIQKAQHARLTGLRPPLELLLPVRQREALLRQEHVRAIGHANHTHINVHLLFQALQQRDFL